MSTSILLKQCYWSTLHISYLVNFLTIRYKTRKQPTLGLLYSPVLLDMINICVDVFQYAFGESWLGLPWLRGMCDQVLNEFLFLTFIYLTLLWVRRNRRHSHLQSHSSHLPEPAICQKEQVTLSLTKAQFSVNSYFGCTFSFTCYEL